MVARGAFDDHAVSLTVVHRLSTGPRPLAPVLRAYPVTAGVRRTAMVRASVTGRDCLTLGAGCR